MPLPQPVPDLVSLDLLRSVADLGSIRQAAARHLISQPAASMRLRALERSFGIELLERSSSGARLTDAGVVVSQWVEPVLESMEALLAGVGALRGTNRPPLALAASLTVAEYLVPRWLQRVRSERPGFAVSLRMGNSEQVAEMVRRREVELGFTEGSAAAGGLAEAVVGRDELVIVVGATHPWAKRRRPLDASTLAATPLVLREPGSGTREVLARALGGLGLEPVPLVELGSTTAIKGAVEAGVGPAALSALTVADDLRDGRLVAVAVRGLDLSRAMRAIWRSDRRLSPSARALLAAAGVKPTSPGREREAVPAITTTPP